MWLQFKLDVEFKWTKTQNTLRGHFDPLTALCAAAIDEGAVVRSLVAHPKHLPFELQACVLATDAWVGKVNRAPRRVTSGAHFAAVTNRELARTPSERGCAVGGPRSVRTWGWPQVAVA